MVSKAEILDSLIWTQYGASPFQGNAFFMQGNGRSTSLIDKGIQSFPKRSLEMAKRPSPLSHGASPLPNNC